MSQTLSNFDEYLNTLLNWSEEEKKAAPQTYKQHVAMYGSRINEAKQLYLRKQILAEDIAQLSKAYGADPNSAMADPYISEKVSELKKISTQIDTIMRTIQDISAPPQSEGAITVGRGEEALQFTSEEMNRLLDPNDDFLITQWNDIRKRGTPEQLKNFTDFFGEQYIKQYAQEQQPRPGFGGISDMNVEGEAQTPFQKPVQANFGGKATDVLNTLKTFLGTGQGVLGETSKLVNNLSARMKSEQQNNLRGKI